MKEDFLEVLKNANRLEKSLKNKSIKIDIKIAVIGSIALQHFVKVLRYQLNNCGIHADLYEGEYNGITMDVFQDDSPLFQFKPDMVIVLTHYSDIYEYPYVMDDDETINNLVKRKVDYYKKVWDRLSCIKDCVILQSNYVIPSEIVFGNLENKVRYSKSSFLRNVNDGLDTSKPDNVIIVDVEQLACGIGKLRWFDYSAFFLNKSGCRLDFLPDYTNLFVSVISNIKGKIRKCLVLDLDNTLWGGVVGDLGCQGIQIDPNNAVGEAYLFFQKYVKALKQKGVILAICSKNDEWIAKEPFEKNKNMILKLDDIGCFIANWDDKATNLKKIASYLNIGVDSLVFFDDNPAERQIVQQFLPDVLVVDVPEDPADYTIALSNEQPFNWISITKEDILRANSYIQNVNRVKLMEDFVDYNDYLKALEMKGDSGLLQEEDIERFTQLINKSNQFNLRTQRYTDSQIRSFTNDQHVRCIYVKLADRFSDYGLISCIIIKKINKSAFIDTWVMSCRVLKRDVEFFAFEEIIKQCINMGCNEITGEYLETKKNGMVRDFLESLGFEVVSNNDSRKQYKYTIRHDIRHCSTFIERRGEKEK